MGMDLIALNDESVSFHANWFSWGLLSDLLVELGCDTSLMSGSNDGDVVDAATARAWGAAIQENEASILVMEFPDKSFEGGMRLEFHVAGTRTPVVTSANVMAEAAVAALLGRETPEPTTPERIVPLKERPSEHAYVLSFARFCEESGGFAQY